MLIQVAMDDCFIPTQLKSKLYVSLPPQNAPGQLKLLPWPTSGMNMSVKPVLQLGVGGNGQPNGKPTPPYNILLTLDEVHNWNTFHWETKPQDLPLSTAGVDLFQRKIIWIDLLRLSAYPSY